MPWDIYITTISNLNLRLTEAQKSAIECQALNLQDLVSFWKDETAKLESALNYIKQNFKQ